MAFPSSAAPARAPRPAPHLRRLAAVTVASLALLGAGCSQDTASTGVEPGDAEVLPPQQPQGGDDPTLTGESTDGVGDGNTGGVGSGSPDSGAGPGVGSGDGTAGDSPTAGEDG